MVIPRHVGALTASHIQPNVDYLGNGRLVRVERSRYKATCPRCGFEWQVRPDRWDKRKSDLCASCTSVKDPLWSTP